MSISSDVALSLSQLPPEALPLLLPLRSWGRGSLARAPTKRPGNTAAALRAWSRGGVVRRFLPCLAFAASSAWQLLLLLLLLLLRLRRAATATTRRRSGCRLSGGECLRSTPRGANAWE